MRAYHPGTQIRQVLLHLGRRLAIEFAVAITSRLKPFITNFHQGAHRPVKIRLQIIPYTIQLQTYRLLFSRQDRGETIRHYAERRESGTRS